MKSMTSMTRWVGLVWVLCAPVFAAGISHHRQSYDPVSAVLQQAGLGHLMPAVTHMFAPWSRPAASRHYLYTNGGRGADAIGTLTRTEPKYIVGDNAAAGQLGRRAMKEAASTNSALYSNTFDNAAWNTTTGATVAQDVSDVDGVANAGWTMTATAVTDVHTRSQTVSLASGYKTLSVYAKAGTATRIMLRFNGASVTRGRGFDLSAGTTFAVTGVTTSTYYGMAAVGGGWYRCWITHNVAETLTDAGVFIVSGTDASWIGAGETVSICRAQLESKGLCTSYIPTGATAVNRSRDTLHLATTIPSIGWMLAVYRAQFGMAANGSWCDWISDNTAANRVGFYGQPTGIFGLGYKSGASIFSSGVWGAYTTGSIDALLMDWSASGASAWRNGSSVESVSGDKTIAGMTHIFPGQSYSTAHPYGSEDGGTETLALIVGSGTLTSAEKAKLTGAAFKAYIAAQAGL